MTEEGDDDRAGGDCRGGGAMTEQGVIAEQRGYGVSAGGRWQRKWRSDSRSWRRRGGGVRGGGRWQRKWRSDSRSWRVGGGAVSEEGDDGRESGGVTADRGGGCQRRGTMAEKVEE